MKTLMYIFLIVIVANQAHCQDKKLAIELAYQLKNNSRELGLYFPGTVKRFYLENQFQPVWIKPQDGMGKTWQAMLLLDCVLQFGLAHADYHPNELSYDSLHTMLEEPGKLPVEAKARFEIVLTDALIAFINHLHYGKYNPKYTPELLDLGQNLPFLAEENLRTAFLEKDFMSAVRSVQPKSNAYKALQEYMRLVKGQYTGDCYEVPEADIRLVAINMERMRWADLDDRPQILVNIPSFTLNLYEPDSVYEFKVIVGKPEHPTPTLKSAIGYFTTAPDWKVPQKIFIRELLPKALENSRYFEAHNYSVYNRNGTQVNINSVKLKEISKNPSAYSLRQSSGCDNALGSVVFRFPNDFDVYLHDSPDQKLFDRQLRSLSHGCIRVQRAADLAALLLKYDGASDQIATMRKNTVRYLKKDFNLKKPVPIKITYLTCGIRDGQLERYKDIYHLDQILEDKLYKVRPKLALN